MCRVQPGHLLQCREMATRGCGLLHSLSQLWSDVENIPRWLLGRGGKSLEKLFLTLGSLTLIVPNSRIFSNYLLGMLLGWLAWLWVGNGSGRGDSGGSGWTWMIITLKYTKVSGTVTKPKRQIYEDNRIMQYSAWILYSVSRSILEKRQCWPATRSEMQVNGMATISQRLLQSWCDVEQADVENPSLYNLSHRKRV